MILHIYIYVKEIPNNIANVNITQSKKQDAISFSLKVTLPGWLEWVHPIFEVKETASISALICLYDLKQVTAPSEP